MSKSAKKRLKQIQKKGRTPVAEEPTTQLEGVSTTTQSISNKFTVPEGQDNLPAVELVSNKQEPQPCPVPPLETVEQKGAAMDGDKSKDQPEKSKEQILQERKEKKAEKAAKKKESKPQKEVQAVNKQNENTPPVKEGKYRT